jgi:hypothetical protein
MVPFTFSVSQNSSTGTGVVTAATPLASSFEDRFLRCDFFVVVDAAVSSFSLTVKHRINTPVRLISNTRDWRKTQLFTLPSMR